MVYYRLIREIGAFKASMSTFFMPVFGMFWGYLFLDEPVTSAMIGGALLILISTGLSLYRPRPVLEVAPDGV